MFPFQTRSLRLTLAAMGSLIGLSACATADITRTGFLSDYSRLEERTDTIRAKVAQYRDEDLLNTVRAVWIEPTVLAGNICRSFLREGEGHHCARDRPAHLFCPVLAAGDPTPNPVADDTPACDGTAYRVI